MIFVAGDRYVRHHEVETDLEKALDVVLVRQDDQRKHVALLKL